LTTGTPLDIPSLRAASAKGLGQAPLLQWQANNERAALAFYALDSHRATVLFYDFSGASQAETGAGDAARDITGAAKALEYYRYVGLGNADALIANGDVRRVIVARNADLDFAPRGTVLHGIRQQVRRNPFQTRRIVGAHEFGDRCLKPNLVQF
jgi:hypothetical protein